MAKLHTEINKITENPIEYIYSWSVPERHWEPKDKAWYIIYAFFFLVIIVLLLILGEYLLILLVLAFLFLWFVQGSTPPLIVEHVITTIGIKSFNKLYTWQEIKDFWFSKKGDVIQLNLDIINPEHPDAAFKSRWTLLVEEGEDKTLFNILIRFINYGFADEVGANILSEIIYGKYVDLDTYMPKENLEEEVDKVIEDEKKSEAPKPVTKKTKSRKKTS